MTLQPIQDANGLTQTVKDHIHNVQKRTAGVRKTHSFLLFGSIAGSAVTTVVAGVTAAAGPVIGQGIPGWRFACSVAALFGFISTLATTLIEQLRVGERAVKGHQCVGRLKALEVNLVTGSSKWEEVTKEYAGILKEYSEFIA